LITTTIPVTTTINSTLKCYVCDVQFPNNQLYFIDQCQFPTNKSISVLTPLTCNSDQDTCMVIDTYNNKSFFLLKSILQVQRTRKSGINREIQRSCTTSNSCSSGCSTSGYGISTTVCTSCCNTDGCNTDNRGVNVRPRPRFLNILFILITISKI
jgi:hypothetical protein